VYTLIRLGIFAVVLTVLYLLGIEPWIAAVIAAIISLCISIIFLRKPREEASRTLYEARQNRGQASRPAPSADSSPAARRAGSTEDEDVEDSAVDGTDRSDRSR
jgi:L-lactate permease